VDKVTIISRKTYYISVVIDREEFNRMQKNNALDEVIALVDQEEADALEGVFEGACPEFLVVKGDVSDQVDEILETTVESFSSDIKEVKVIKAV
jgi:hypothetical protein